MASRRLDRRLYCLPSGCFDRRCVRHVDRGCVMSKWTDQEMRDAELIRRQGMDTYRLHYIKTGKMLDVPGWMVGDAHMVETRARAAEIIRKRVTR